MPSIVRPLETKFYSELNNGVNFDLNLTDFAPLLKACINENVRFETKVVVGSYVEFSNWKIIGTNYFGSIALQFRILKGGAGFGNTFSVGDSLTLYYKDFIGFIRGTVIQSTDDWLDFSLVSSSGTVPEGEISEQCYIANESDLQGLEYKFGIIENDDPVSFSSKLTNSQQLFRVSDIPITTGQPDAVGVSSGINKAWVTGNVSCNYLGNVEDNNTLNDAKNKTFKEFIITHEFKVSPLFLDGQEESIQGLEDAPEDYLEGAKSLKYVFESSFMNTINDPNTAKSAVWDSTKGSVGYYGESFNGFATSYSLDNVAYFNKTLNENTTKLKIGDLVNVSFSVYDSSNSFQNGDALVLGHSAILNSTKYYFSTEDYKTLWSDETLRINIGSSAVSNDIIKDAQATLVSSGEILISYDVSYDTNQINRIDKGQNYILDVILQKSGQTINTGGKTLLRIDYNTYDKNTDIQGLFFVDRFEHFEHADEYIDFNTIGKTNIICNIEENLFSISDFYLDVSKYAILESLSFEIVAYNTIDKSFNALRSVEFDLSDQVLAGSIQNIEYEDTRDYVLLDDDIFNSLKLTTTNLDVDNQHYNIEIGYKIPWQSWNAFLEASVLFYDKTLENNGLNDKCDRYSGVNNYQIRVLVNANVSQNGIVTNYVHTSEEVKVYGYEEDENPPSTYVSDIKTFSEDGFELENNVLLNGITEQRSIFTPNSLPTFSESIDFTEVSTVWGRYAHGNELLPPATIAPRSGDWILEQANDTDIFTDTSSLTHVKSDAGLYDSTTTSIETNDNCNAFYGCFSNDEYETYKISGNVFSNNADNDAIAYNICFFIDELGNENTLSFVFTTGGLEMGLSSAFELGNNQTSTFAFPNSTVKVALLYNFGKRDCVQLGLIDTGELTLNWNDSQVSDLSFSVVRNGADIKCSLENWQIRGNTYLGSIDYNLNDDINTEKFIGFNSIGFGFMSQNEGGFKDVLLEIATSDYYAINRIQDELNPSDSSLNTISSHREGKANEALIQMTGQEVKSSFSWDGTSFLNKCFVNSDKIDLSKKYKLSAQIGALTTQSITPSDFSEDFSLDFS